MKQVFFRISLMLALAFLAAAQMVRAQEAMLVNIPFAFTAGKAALPAGEYRVEKLSLGSIVLAIRSTDLSASAYVTSFATETAAPQPKSKLVFHRYRNRYFLFQVWTGGSRRGRQLRKSPQEKEQALAAQGEMPAQVTIVARLEAPKP